MCQPFELEAVYLKCECWSGMDFLGGTSRRSCQLSCQKLVSTRQAYSKAGIYHSAW